MLKHSRDLRVFNYVNKLTPLLLAALLLACFATGTARAAEPLSSAFSATLDFNSEEVNSPQRIPQIEFSGDIVIVDDRMRVETFNNLTQMPTVALLDITARTAALLYPDTLNGERMPLGDEFRASYLDLFRSFALGRELGEVKGWKLAKSSADDGAKQYSYSGQSKRTITFTIGGKADVRRLVINSPKVKVTINLDSVLSGDSVARPDFSIPADFSMRDSDTSLADVLPSL